MPDNTNDIIKRVTEKAYQFLEILEIANIEVGSQKLYDLINKPISLRDTKEFNVKVKIPSNDELREARHEIAGAIAAEKWVEGFRVALGVLSMFG